MEVQSLRHLTECNAFTDDNAIDVYTIRGQSSVT